MNNTFKKEDKRMTTEQKKEVLKKAYYMTQYASYTTDEGVYEALLSSIDENETDYNLMMEFLELTPSVSDFINQKVYDSVFYNLNDEKIETLIKLYGAIENENIGDLEDLFHISFYDLFDGYVGDYDFFETLADDDLKCNGINADAIRWADKIPYDGSIYELDCYHDFNEITFDDILERIFDNYDLNDIL